MPTSMPLKCADGMEALDVTDATLEALGMPGFGPTVSVDCANHGGSGAALVQQWDASAKTWNAVTGIHAVRP